VFRLATRPPTVRLTVVDALVTGHGRNHDLGS
jgi:hypothetical protein